MMLAPACAPCGVVIAGAWQLLVVLLVQASSSQLLAVLLVSRRLR
jgi:predicted branched-subunit amino acid permease